MGALIKFSTIDANNIIKAYKSGIGVGGIAKNLGLNCSEHPIKRLLRKKFGALRNPSEQQQIRMDNMSFEEKCANAKAANNAMRGSKVKVESLIKKAKTIEGTINKLSFYEPIVYELLVDNGFNPIPGKAIHTYNADFSIGSVTVEVFGGGWSISDKNRLNRYIGRTKEIGRRGFHTIFIILTNEYLIGNGSELIRAINEFSCLPTIPSKYRVIRGNTECSTGLSCNIDNSAFVSPFVKGVDPATGRYIRLP